MNILIVRVSSLGDVVHTLPAISLLQQQLPQAKIHWLVQNKAAEIVHLHKGITKVWQIPDNYLYPRHWHTMYKTIKQLRTYQWDAIIDFQGLIKTTIITALLNGPVFGFNQQHARSRITSIFSTHTTDAYYTNIIQKNLTLASYVCSRLTQQHSSPSLINLTNPTIFNYSQDCVTTVTSWLSENNINNHLLISPNTTWESKHWPLEYWQEFLTTLSLHTTELSITPILIGNMFGYQGTALAEFITTQQLPIKILPQWSLSNLTYLINQTHLLIAPDTGLLHLADFLGRNTIGIFGPTLASKHGPFLHPDNIRNNIQIACSHRYAKKHAKNPNTGQNDTCMYTLTPNTLMHHVMHQLAHNKQ